MKIARPLLIVITPLGVIAGLHEAWRMHGWLAVLMALLLSVLAALFAMTWRPLRRESR